MTSRIRLAGAALLFAFAFSSVASADEIVVEMLNSDGEGKKMLFKPDFIKANVGDTVKFVPTQQPHNAQSIPEIWPEGAEQFTGEINKEVTFKIEKPGIYGVKCMPHYGMGMIALIQAGDERPNEAQLDTYKPRGKDSTKRFDELKAQVGK